jgi:hypothetical protein
MNALDFMLKNTEVLHISIVVILIVSFLYFRQIEQIHFFVIVVFIAVKFTTASYVDLYIEKKRALKEFAEVHFIGVKVLTSLIITIPFVLLAFYTGHHIPMHNE